TLRAQTRQRVEGLRDRFGLHRDFRLAHDLPRTADLFQRERAPGPGVGQPIDLGGVERRPHAPAAVFRLDPVRQSGVEQEHQVAVRQLGVAAWAVNSLGVVLERLAYTDQQTQLLLAVRLELPAD